MRVAYADPPYPGKAHLYPENEEVDHVALVARLCEYDGWALGTDEPALSHILSLCPPSTRVLVWCKTDSPPRMPYPWFSHEFVLCKPARVNEHAIRSYHVGPAPPRGFCGPGGLIGAKSSAFCEWVIRCLGATDEDTFEDIFPGTGVMGRSWAAFVAQPELRAPEPAEKAWGGQRNMRRRTHDPLPGLDGPAYAPESWK